MQEANRLKRLPLYLFTIIDDLKRRARERGVDVIDFGMGSPDQPTPPHIVAKLCEAAQITENHRYSRADGPVERRFRQSIANWYKKRFDVTLDPNTEVLPLIGTKEGIAHLSLAYLNNDDIAIVPSPAYPTHFNGVIVAGGILYNLPLSAEHGFLPDLDTIPKEVIKMAKLMFISYPHNPTGAVCDIHFYEKVVKWAQGKNIIIASDLTYSDFVYDGKKTPSFLQVPGSRDFGIEFHTLSKSYNMTGWRIGFAVGNAGILKTLGKTKSYLDFGIFRAVQEAAIAALDGPQDCVENMRKLYEERRNVLVDGLNAAGWKTEKPKATFYVWTRIPAKYSALTALEFCTLMVDEIGVAVAPGTGFGEYGEGWVRFALVEPVDRIKLAVGKIKKLLEEKA
ncbi:MAG TPA: LL-diaminopimelate aminotransferase [Candidatus Eisenbacteria bacterium]|nr:LL-diaminopimelate aminotransferase [Candidatus Eisenbacteria bacterium]